MVGLLLALHSPLLLLAFDPTETADPASDSSAVIDPTTAVLDLHAHNFDDAILKHDEILVHFHAPWSKRCEELRPHLSVVQRGSEWGGRFVHAESDISDSRGYTSYLERYGVTRLPALVLFRNGHPSLFPPEEPLEMASVDAWLYRTTQETPLPRGAISDAAAIKMLVRTRAAIRPIRPTARAIMCTGASRAAPCVPASRAPRARAASCVFASRAPLRGSPRMHASLMLGARAGWRGAGWRGAR